MADQESELLELDAADIVEEPEGQENEVVIEDIAFADEESPPQDDTNLVKQLRSVIAEQGRKLKAITPREKPIEIGEMPKLEDFDYDGDRFAAAVIDHETRKRQAESQQSEARKRQEAVEAEFAQEMELVDTAEARLGLSGFQEARDTVEASLSDNQLKVLIRASDDPGKMIYALAKSQAKLSELSETTDLIKLAAKVATMEKTIQARKAPALDRPTQGGGVVGVKFDEKLAKLEAAAAKSGNYNELFAYRRSLKK